MAASKVIVYLFTILVPLAFVFSEDAQSVPEAPQNQPESEEGHEAELQNRFFFNIPRLTSCNFTSEPGRTCRSCNTALTCLSSNVGILQVCRGIFRNCNNGRCSLNQEANCTSSGAIGLLSLTYSSS